MFDPVKAVDQIGLAEKVEALVAGHSLETQTFALAIALIHSLAKASGGDMEAAAAYIERVVADTCRQMPPPDLASPKAKH